MQSRSNDTLRAKLVAALEERSDILEAYLFGSRARGDARVDSDYDVAGFFDPRAGQSFLERSIDLAAALAPVVGSDSVDVVALNGAPPLLYHRVLSEGELLVSRDLVATTRRAGQAVSRYCDYVPHLAKIDYAHRLRISAGAFGR